MLPPEQASFAAVVWFVQAKGWRADLGPVCKEFGVAHLTPDCIFKQISVEVVGGSEVSQGFNVPMSATESIPYALLFHLHPLVGKFFIVSPSATLQAAFVRSQGTGYSRLPNEIAQWSFESEIAFWLASLGKIRQLMRKQRVPDLR